MDFSFVHITDHHITPSDADLLHGFSPRHSLRRVMRHIAENEAVNADFMVSSGDLVERPTEESYQSFLEMIQPSEHPVHMPGPLLVTAEGLKGLPTYLLPGNHDDRDQFYKSLFHKSQPNSLMNFCFTHKGVQFICMDWGSQSKASVAPETMQFLANSLAGNAPSIIFMHHHASPVGSRWLDEFIAEGVQEFWDIVSTRNILGMFCGHTHLTYEKVICGVPVFGLRSTSYSFALQDVPLACLTPPHYRLITLQNGQLTTQLFEVPL